MAKRELYMRYAGGLVRHLGLQMYAGAVPAIAELVANAWDADASNVWIELPLDTPIEAGSEIRVKDDGVGMTFEEANELYLVVGRDRRASGPQFTGQNRKVMGRKGLGKLAGFGAAQVLEVWTVKQGRLTAFRMDYEAIVSHGHADFVAPYRPEVLADRPVKATDPLQKGTLIVLKRLQLKKAVSGRQFRASMIRRFAVFSDSFRVHINGEPLTREEMEFQFRFPPAGRASDEVAGGGSIRWWVGFTKEPIPDEAARGISVLARGKLAQAPFFFDLSGGAFGQHGMQYMTGEVEADFLDESDDLIATDRASVLWEDPRARPLLEWGQKKVRELLRSWAEERRKAQRKRLRDTTPYFSRLEKFPERQQTELRAAIEKLASIPTIEDKRLDELVDFLFKAYENETFMELIRAISATEPEAQEQLLRLFTEWDVLEAIGVAQRVRGRVEVIRKFRAMIEAAAPEKPDMQDFVKARPWLLHPQWDMLQHERSLDTVLAKEFHAQGEGEEGQRRLDFFCIADTAFAVVVELKRPGDLIGREQLDQLERYVDYLRTWERQSNEPTRRPRRTIQGCLVYSRLKPEAEEKKRRLQGDGMFVTTWEALLTDAERLHREYLEVVKARAPQEDPRIQALAMDAEPGTLAQDPSGTESSPDADATEAAEARGE